MLENKRIQDLKITDFDLFLERTGWYKADPKNRNHFLYTKDIDGFDAEIILPKTSSVIDFYRRVEEAIRLLASIDSKPPEEIVSQIYSIDRDFIKLKLIDRCVSQNTVALSMAGHVINSLNKLMKFSAAQTETSKAYYTRPTDKALKYSENLRFGHTFKGSFGFTVESPLNLPTLGSPQIGVSETFERQVVNRTYSSLQIVEDATRDGSASKIVDSFSSGLNANMCEAIVDLSKDIQDIEVLYNFSFSPIIPSPTLEMEQKTFKLEPHSFRLLDDAAKQLKNSVDEYNGEIVGAVTILKAQPGFLNHEELSRQVTVNGQSSDRQHFNITTSLNTSDYQTACNAHRDGKMVMLKGSFRRGANRRWELTEYNEFKMIDEA